MTETANPILHLDPHARVLAITAVRGGVATSVQQLSDGNHWLELAIGANRYLYRYGGLFRVHVKAGRTLLAHINGDGADIMFNKTRTTEVLAAAGLSTPPGRTFNRSQLVDALDYAMALGPPVCLKPLRGSKGVSVFPNLASAEWIRKALVTVASQHEEFRLEKHVGEQEIRYFYAAPNLVGLLIAEMLIVVGDGVSTVRKLGEAVNLDRASRSQTSHGPIEWDEDRVELLATQGMSVDTVPARGTKVQLSRTANRNRGGIGLDGRGRVHPSYARLAKAAFEAIPGLKVAALDMRLTSRDIEATPDNYWILEINSSPGLTGYHSLWDGAQDVAGAVLRWLIADAKGSGSASG